jgi:hypothetical protein
MDFSESPQDSTNSTPIQFCHFPKTVGSEPPHSTKPILSDGYELCPCLIEMVQNQTFSGKEDENPHTHLNEFEQTCACLHIKGMSDETLRWKLFPFSLEGKDKIWYSRTAPSKEGSWEALCSSFFLDFFPISKIICLRLEIISFTQKDNESLVATWERFDNLVHSGPSLSIPDPVLLQHFYIGLDGKTSSFLNSASNGSFLHTSAPVARELLLKIAQSTPKAEPIEFLEEKKF